MFYTMYNTVQKSKVRVLVEKHLIFCGIICTVRNILSAYIICLEVCTEKKRVEQTQISAHLYFLLLCKNHCERFFFLPYHCCCFVALRRGRQLKPHMPRWQREGGVSSVKFFSETQTLQLK